jgi:hypothetical protein
MNKQLREKIIEINADANGGLSDDDWVKKYGDIKFYDVILHAVDEALPKEKTNKYWMKKLKVPDSDYSWGHKHGYKYCLSDIHQLLK